MGLVAQLGQLNLALALLRTAAGLLRQAVVAMRTADALLELRRGHVLGGDRVTAGMALIKGAGGQIVTYGYPVIKHETLALPLALFHRDIFQVLQNAALEVVHLFKAFLEHEAGGFFTADASGAEHGHLLVLLRIELLTHILGKLAEGSGLRIDRSLEGADGNLVVIAGIDQQHFRIADQRVPVLGLDIGADPLIGADTRNADGDDFLLQFDLGAVEGHFLTEGLLPVQITQARITPQPFEQRAGAFAGTGDSAVDTFQSQQQRTFHTMFVHGVEQRLAQAFKIFQGDELVQRHHDNLGHADLVVQLMPA